MWQDVTTWHSKKLQFHIQGLNRTSHRKNERIHALFIHRSPMWRGSLLSSLCAHFLTREAYFLLFIFYAHIFEECISKLSQPTLPYFLCSFFLSPLLVSGRGVRRRNKQNRTDLNTGKDPCRKVTCESPKPLQQQWDLYRGSHCRRLLPSGSMYSSRIDITVFRSLRKLHLSSHFSDLQSSCIWRRALSSGILFWWKS